MEASARIMNKSLCVVGRPLSKRLGHIFGWKCGGQEAWVAWPVARKFWFCQGCNEICWVNLQIIHVLSCMANSTQYSCTLWEMRDSEGSCVAQGWGWHPGCWPQLIPWVMFPLSPLEALLLKSQMVAQLHDLMSMNNCPTLRAERSSLSNHTGMNCQWLLWDF